MCSIASLHTWTCFSLGLNLEVSLDFFLGGGGQPLNRSPDKTRHKQNNNMLWG